MTSDLDWGESDIEELRYATETGLLCSSCGCEFVSEHGKPVACGFCWSRLPLAEQQVIPKATHEERTRAAHRDIAREYRARGTK